MSDRPNKTRTAELKRAVFARDRGVCKLCGRDSELDRETFLRRYPQARYVTTIHATHPLAVAVDRLYNLPHHRLLYRYWWDMDHIVPLEEGGDPEALSNLQTLCLQCHNKKSKDNAISRNLSQRKSCSIKEPGGADT